MEKMRLTGASRGRRDQYFQGSKAGQFRSPAEFFEHAEWLLNDMEGQCQCQYCYKDYVGRGSKKSIVSSSLGFSLWACVSVLS